MAEKAEDNVAVINPNALHEDVISKAGQISGDKNETEVISLHSAGQNKAVVRVVDAPLGLEENPKEGLIEPSAGEDSSLAIPLTFVEQVKQVIRHEFTCPVIRRASIRTSILILCAAVFYIMFNRHDVAAGFLLVITALFSLWMIGLSIFSYRMKYQPGP